MITTREYKALLANKLQQLRHQQYVTFERWELLAWYGKDRITAVVWRDIQECCMAIFTDGVPKLGVIKCDDTPTPQKYVVINLAAVVKIETLG